MAGKKHLVATVLLASLLCGAAQPHIPTTEGIDVSAVGALGNRLAACHLTGDVTLWVSRPVEILDDMHKSVGSIEAGLAQFGERSTLRGCVPDGSVLDLSGQFANFRAGGRPARDERCLRPR